jgi:hypothetical protein
VYTDTSIDGRPLSSGANFSRDFRQAMASSRARLESESVRAQSASGRIQQLNRSRCNSADPRLERRPASSGEWSDERLRGVSLSLEKLENAEDEASDVQSCRVCAMMRHCETKYHLCSIHRNAKVDGFAGMRTCITLADHHSNVVVQSTALKACDRTRITEYPVTPPVHQQCRSSGSTTSLGLRGSPSASGAGIHAKPRTQKLGVAVPCYTTDDILCKFQCEDENLIKVRFCLFETAFFCLVFVLSKCSPIEYRQILRYEARATKAKRLVSLFDEYVPKLSVDDTSSRTG